MWIIRRIIRVWIIKIKTAVEKQLRLKVRKERSTHVRGKLGELGIIQAKLRVSSRRKWIMVLNLLRNQVK